MKLVVFAHHLMIYFRQLEIGRLVGPIIIMTYVVVIAKMEIAPIVAAPTVEILAGITVPQLH
jgi:hypothetical protein